MNSMIRSFLPALAAVSGTALMAQSPDANSYTGRLEAVHTYAGPSEIRLGQAELGDLESQFTRVTYGGTFNDGAELSWGVGVGYSRWDFGRPAGAPLPSDLQSITVPISAQWKFRENWQVFGELSPGIYSDFVDLRSEDFNAPFLGGIGYSFNRDLQVFLTLSLDGRRDVPVVGGPGVRWRFAEAWTLQLLLPRPQIQFRPSGNWLLHVGAELTGGAFHLHPNYGTERGVPAMDDQFVNYREIRTGAGVRWGGEKGLAVSLEAGWMIDRRFVFDDIRLQYNGDGAPYGRLSLNYRY
jgi:hypothetical protein